MATKPKTASWSKLLILVGDGATPTEVFAAPCGLTSKGFNRSAETSDTVVPFCDAPDDPTWTERVVRALSATVSGSGVLALESLDIWDDWFQGGQARNVRVRLDVPLADNGRHWAVAMVLTVFNVVGNLDDGKIQVEVELQNDGPVVVVAASA